MKALPVSGWRDPGMGYGRLTANVAGVLEQRGVDTRPDPPGPTVPATHLAITTPPMAAPWRKGQRAVILTMWETDIIPPTFLHSIWDFDHVIVPCDMNVELFSRHHPSVSKAPLAVGPEWGFRERKSGGPFLFMSSGVGKRKGIDIALKAFAVVRAELKDDVRLVLRSEHSIQQDGVLVMQDHISAEDEVELYASVNCYLAPTRGEGWGLMPHQAIAQGCPTILTNAHGQAEYAHLGIPISAGKSLAELPTWGAAGHWWEPDFDELVDAMFAVYCDYGHYADLAEKNSAEARAFTWEKTADAILPYLGDLEATIPRGAPHRVTLPRYRVVVNQHLSCDIGGVSFRFSPGADYYEVADVKRVLRDAGYLDPSCIAEEDEGQMGKVPSAAVSQYGRA